MGDLERWAPASVLELDQFLLGPLAWESASGGVEMRHGSYSEERRRACWDAPGAAIVLVVDFQREEYWGERALMAQEQAPNMLRLSYERRQSDLWELGPRWQGPEAISELRALGSAACERLCALVQGAIAAREERRAIALEAPLGPTPGTRPGPRRV